MRSLALGALLIALASCNGSDDAKELASGTNELNAAQIDAALGPADQSGIEDVGPAAAEENNLASNEADAANAGSAVPNEAEAQ